MITNVNALIERYIERPLDGRQWNIAHALYGEDKTYPLREIHVA